MSRSAPGASGTPGASGAPDVAGDPEAAALAAATRDLVARALAEDLGEDGDVTSEAVVPPDVHGVGTFLAVEAGVLAGTDAATEVFAQLDDGVEVRWDAGDGDAVPAGAALGRVAGPLRSVLAGERTALNLLSHLSGVATATRRFVDAAGGGVGILDTRKTLPGLRRLEKAAVRAGGGVNHRMGLSDAVLVKDNHLRFAGVAEAVALARRRWPDRMVEVECDTLEQLEEAIGAVPDRVLLDNMTPGEVGAAVARVAEAAASASRPRIEVEASGGVTLDNVARYAAAGPDFVSVGALTHSAPALDVSLDTSVGAV